MTSDREPANDSNSSPVSIGCGSLILIAIIVLMFSGQSRLSTIRSSTQRIQREVNQLDRQLRDIENKLDLLIEKIEKR